VVSIKTIKGRSGGGILRAVFFSIILLQAGQIRSQPSSGQLNRLSWSVLSSRQRDRGVLYLDLICPDRAVI